MSDSAPPPAYHDHHVQQTSATIRSSIEQLIYTVRSTVQSTYTPDVYTQSLLDKIYSLERTNTHLHQQLDTLTQCYRTKQHDIAHLHQQLYNIVSTQPDIQQQCTLNTGVQLADSAYATAKSVLSYVPLASRVVNVAESTLYTVQSHVLPPSLHLLHKSVTVTSLNSPKLPPQSQLTDRSISSTSITSDTGKLVRRDSTTAATQLETLLKLQTHIVAQLRAGECRAEVTGATDTDADAGAGAQRPVPHAEIDGGGWQGRWGC